VTAVELLDLAAYRVPTDGPEADGTLAWDSTTIVVVRLRAGGETGLGWSYGPAAIAALIAGELEPVVRGRDPLDVGGAARAMTAALRNACPFGLSAYAVSAVDIALHDLKARLVGVSVADLLGRVRPAVPVYGSGGFTSYPIERLQEQLAGWVRDGIGAVKMKVGSDAAADPERVAAARAAIGDEVELMVDANGAWSATEAVAMAERFAARRVGWFEEPVSSDDVAGLAHVRARAPAGMAIAAGEYATDAFGFRRLLEAGAVDVLQADVTRCGGITGVMRAAALCDADGVPLSAHCAPALSCHVLAAVPCARDIEYFHDHVRLEGMLFDGVPATRDGALWPDPARPGLGVELREADAERFRA
jgi:L-alanine-DL-glutamate epimerase-like enolase superfamily enzyme